MAEDDELGRGPEPKILGLYDNQSTLHSVLSI